MPAMAKAPKNPGYSCSNCGAPSLRWAGRCTRCGEFGTVDAVVAPASEVGLRATTAGSAPSTSARAVRSILAAGPARRTPTGIAEFDRILGGGLVAGQVLLLSGEPGAGKSTLLLTVADAIAAATGQHTLYLSGEESVDQLAIRARRIGVGSEHLYLADETDLAKVIGHIDEHGPQIALVIVDSVQTVASADVEGRAGGVAQVMAVAHALTRVAKARGIPICLVGQVTKESTVAGPRALEHVVDTTLSLDGDRHTSLRLLRTVKNRYGQADEVACFEQTDAGLREVPDPSLLFRGHRDDPVSGTCVTVTVEGRRAMLAEVQALVSASSIPTPRRGVSGLDSARVAMLAAVTDRHGGQRLADREIFVATVGGIRLADPATDLAVCLALASAALDNAGKPTAVPLDVVAIGEVSLSGDIRPTRLTNQRLSEAIRLGFRRILAPVGTRVAFSKPADEHRIIEVATLAAAIQEMRTMRGQELRPPGNTR